MAVQIQMRRDTAANWTSGNPTLAAGELGLETDTKKIKMGDGSTAWTSLAYFVHEEKTFCIGLFEAGVSVVVADGAVAFVVPSCMNGMNLVNALASVHTKGITGTTDIQIRRRRAGADVDMLSTKITIGDEWYASDEVINTSNDDVNTGDSIYVDVDAIHTTAPQGLSVVLTFQLP